MSKPMSKQMQKVAERYERATTKKFGQKTNADHIRSMTDEELAMFLCGVYDDETCGVYQNEIGKFICGITIIDYDEDKIAEWLQQPYEEEP